MIGVKELQQFQSDMKSINEINTLLFDRTQSDKAKRSDGTKVKRFHPIDDLTEEDFQTKYHFTKDNMSKIVDWIRDDLEAEKYRMHLQNQVPVDLQIMAAIRFWALTDNPDLIAKEHGVTMKVLERICKRVSAALAIKASSKIRMPVTLSEKEQVTSGFEAIAKMPQVIGAISHTTIGLKFNPDKKVGFMGIQVCADALKKIRDIDCKYQSILEDNVAEKIYEHSKLKDRMEQNEFRGRYLLASGQLKQSPFLLTSIVCPNSDEDTTFNSNHLKTYKTVLDCMNHLKARFGILGSDLICSYNTAKNTIISLALLHNLAIEWDDPSVNEIASKTLNSYYNYIVK